MPQYCPKCLGLSSPTSPEKVGVGLRGYQKWEQTGGISWDNLQKLAKVHAVDADWILKGETHGATPDLMGAVSEGDALVELRDQLDRIETIVEGISVQLATLASEPEPVPETQPRSARSSGRTGNPARRRVS